MADSTNSESGQSSIQSDDTSQQDQSKNTQLVNYVQNNEKSTDADATSQTPAVQKNDAEQVQNEYVEINATLQNGDNVDNQNVMAKNDSIVVSLDYHNDNLEKGQNINISYSPNWEVMGWKKGDIKSLDGHFNAKNNGDGTFTIAPTRNSDSESRFNLKFTFQYSQDVDSATNEPLTITLTRDGRSVGSKTFTPIITPYKSLVSSAEIAHGWAAGIKK